ncbi:MAG: LD-carboxypeptidase [Deltaproteobacteria bacterium]|nr:LD-carboxypeptidase [Deltaproteobacteria bacterium]
MAIQKTDSLIPSRLSSGDTIGIVAPAGYFDKDKFHKGVKVLESMGFRVHIPDGVFSKSGYFAGTDAQRADLLKRLFEDNSIKAIACARGGFGSIKILPLLDFKIIKSHPKIFIGFSDVSVLLNIFFEKSGLITFHGPVVTSLANASQKTKDTMFEAITSGCPIEIAMDRPVCIHTGTASGIVIGGNLTTLCHLIGTPYMPSFSGRILVLEDTGEACYRIDRMLTQMKLAGCLDGIAGVAVGSFDDCGSMDELYGVIENIFKEYRIPILAGFDAGHGETNITFPVGLEATLDAGKGKLSFHTPAAK